MLPPQSPVTARLSKFPDNDIIEATEFSTLYFCIEISYNKYIIINFHLLPFLLITILRINNND